MLLWAIQQRSRALTIHHVYSLEARLTAQGFGPADFTREWRDDPLVRKPQLLTDRSESSMVCGDRCRVGTDMCRPAQRSRLLNRSFGRS